MKKMVSMLLALAIITGLKAQTVITGRVTDTRNDPVAAATIRIKETGKGVITDSAGQFILNTSLKGVKTIEASSVSYRTKQLKIVLHDSAVFIDIVLLDEARQLGDVVVVGAGSFEASDKSKGGSLTPMDAMTVAGNGGDIAYSLRSLPGAQQVGEREGLFVRGGTSDEAKQFVDGTLLKSPNYPSVPGLVQPARLNPFLFKGVLFNTGGYSALYGQALSSALILETVDIPEESDASFHIFPTSLGAGYQKTAGDKKSSYGINAQYGSSTFYNNIVKQQPSFFQSPLYISTDVNFRVKTSKTGILKFYTNYGYNHTGFRQADIDSLNLLSSFENKGSNIYANLDYKESLSNKWKIDAGLAYNYSRQNNGLKLEDSSYQQLFIPQFPYAAKNSENTIRSDFAQARIVLTKTFARNQAVRFGAEHFYTKDNYHSNDTLTDIIDNLTAMFAETDIYLTKDIALKAGLRAEHSVLLNQTNLAPRISFAYRFNHGGQINIAYGTFYQKPAWIYLLQNGSLVNTKATHYIINYQKKANNRLLRLEAYYKKYNDLITNASKAANDGSGYAKGIELFFRDKKTFKNFDYWVSYTYLNTKRKFNNYPFLLQPDYTAEHTATFAIKRFFTALNLNINLSYAWATGRPYYNIQNDADNKPYILNSGKTNSHHQMNMSFAYLFSLFKKSAHPWFGGMGAGINNVLGSASVFGYNFSANGLRKMPIVLPAVRNYYFGVFMSIGTDRREDFINNNF